MTLYQPRELGGVWVDACAWDADYQLLFLSAWGNESAVQSLRARLSLDEKDTRRLRSFYLEWRPITIGNIHRLDSTIGKPANSPFINLTHVWIYDKKTLPSHQGTGSGCLLMNPKASPIAVTRQLWEAVMRLSPIPLLASWKDSLLPFFFDKQFIKKREGLAIEAYAIDLNEALLSEIIQEKCQQHALPLPA